LTTGGISLGSVAALFRSAANGYTQVYDGSGTVAVYLGGSSDQQSYYDNAVHNLRGLGGAATAKVQVLGSFAVQNATLNLATTNGANQNLTLPAGGTFVISNQTGAYNIGGLTGGYNGREITIIGTGQVATFNYADAGSAVGNRIYMANAVNWVSPNSYWSVTLKWEGTFFGNWFMTAHTP
jgi:hypothetical protein